MRPLPLEQAAADCRPGLDLENCNGAGLSGTAGTSYWAWTKTDEFKSQMRPIVLADDFLKDNYLLDRAARAVDAAADQRVQPARDQRDRRTTSGTTSRRESYKELPSVGTIKVRHPVTGAEIGLSRCRAAAAATRGRRRSSACGRRRRSCRTTASAASIRARRSRRACASFQDSIEQMLWPEQRDKDPIFANENGPGVGVIDRHDRRQRRSEVPEGYVPDDLRPLLGVGQRLFPFLFSETARSRSVRFPKGIPVGLLANLDLLGAR